MGWSGIIGGNLAYNLLQHINRNGDEAGSYCDSRGYSGKSKLQLMFGKNIWREIKGRVVMDFGCGNGTQAIEMAQHGARRVVGIDSRQKVLDLANQKAASAGVSGFCEFTTRTAQKVDVICSIDGFEHYNDPGQVLASMKSQLKPGGKIYISFGPPWFHPYGGHLFSVFPWAHLIFTEKALIRWRSDFKSDGATRFHEVEGGLNQMTVRRFRKLVRQNDFLILEFKAIPIRKLRWLSNPLTREFMTSVVHCVLGVKE